MIEGYYEELDIKDDHLTYLFDKVVKAINYDTSKVERPLYRPETTQEHALFRVSLGALHDIEESEKDRTVASRDCNVLKFNNINFNDAYKILIPHFRGKIHTMGISGRIWYPVNGFMGWHTNSNNPGFRLYCTYAREGGKSFFRYRHPKTGEIITSYDKEGWTFRLFRVDHDLLWHCVYSETDRFSIGYALYNAEYPHVPGRAD